jgi:hypothetical protein
MKSKKKPSALFKAIEEAVYGDTNEGNESDDNNEETRAKIVDNDDEDDAIFTQDFSATAVTETTKPSRLRVLNASRLDDDGDVRYWNFDIKWVILLLPK